VARRLTDKTEQRIIAEAIASLSNGRHKALRDAAQKMLAEIAKQKETDK
jgi:hypothetical protein